MKKILEFNTPLIDIYSGVAGNIAAIMDKREKDDIIIRNHFLIMYYSEIKAPGFNWKYYDDSFISNEEKSKCTDIVRFIRRSINSNKYIKLYLDHYYIKNSSCYKKVHMLHDDATIFGYDDEKSKILVGDNFKEGKYTIEWVDYEDVIKARKKIRVEEVRTFQIDTSEMKLGINTLNKILDSYLKGENNLELFSVNESHNDIRDDNKFFGINYYYLMKDNVNHYEKYGYDIRNYYMLLEHMKVYECINRYLLNNNIVFNLNEYEKDVNVLINETKQLVNIYLMYSIKHTEKIRESILKRLDTIMSREIEIIEMIQKVTAE